MTAIVAAPERCPYCGMIVHRDAKCPLVSAFEYYPDGVLKRVEFYGPAPLAIAPGVIPNDLNLVPGFSGYVRDES